MKIVVSYLNSVYDIEVKTKSNDKFLNFLFQFIINTKWHFGYTLALCIKILNFPVASKRPFAFLQRNTPFLQMAIFYSEIQTFEN